MTREEAITKLKSFCHNCEKFPTCVNTDKECFKALETAIEALEQEPCDCITLRLKKGALKYSDKDYVVYKKEWLKKWWQPEMMMLGVTLNIAYDNDAISRKAAEMCLTANITDMTIEEYISMVGDRLKGLPSVQPKPKIGHWYIDERPESNRETICSNCEQPIFKYQKIDFDYRPHFCPSCGADMRGDNDDKR